MLIADPNHIARRVLTKISRYYEAENIEEVIMNRPQVIWTKDRGGEWIKHDSTDLDYAYISRLCRVLANINGAKFSEEDLPVVSCELPGRPFRFQAVVGPNVRYDLDDRKGIALAIRALTANTNIDFSSYGLTEEPQDATTISQDGLLEQFDVSGDRIEALREVIGKYQSIIVSGATSTGKTTFANKLIELLPRGERVITVEDARELTVPHENRVHLIVPRNRSANAVGYPEILDAVVRLTPDWIVCGELSVANAQMIYSTMGKGHPVITTVHAGSPEEAVGAFANNMDMSGADKSLSGDSLYESIRSQIGAIIQLQRRDGKRRVVDIQFPSREVAKARKSTG